MPPERMQVMLSVSEAMFLSPFLLGVFTKFPHEDPKWLADATDESVKAFIGFPNVLLSVFLPLRPRAPCSQTSREIRIEGGEGGFALHMSTMIS